jgi:hypothetical protein
MPFGWGKKKQANIAPEIREFLMGILNETGEAKKLKGNDLEFMLEVMNQDLDATMEYNLLDSVSEADKRHYSSAKGSGATADELDGFWRKRLGPEYEDLSAAIVGAYREKRVQQGTS